ncbi:hypothetical protein [Arthrobacter sp.]|uniref:hypothetical protein n=1 Tax=Arthrobacter sp. TaxID=1667 RepID=UPI003A92C1EC
MRHRTATGLAAVALVLPAVMAPAIPAAAAPAGHGHQDAAFTFGVIGDTPYGAEQVAAFPGVIDQLNGHKDLKFIAHVGDVKSGSERCSDERIGFVKEQFDRLKAPLVYTPGDNEWVDPVF